MILQSCVLDYDFKIFLTADHECHSGSCIQHLQREFEDVYAPYGGMPSSYCFENTVIHQLWWTAEQIDFEQIGRQLDIEVITVSSIKQPPGCVVPWHKDSFFQINRRYPDRTDPKVRANIFLEDWKLGHFIQYENNVSTHWQKGHGFIWDSDVLHLGANAGLEPKFTLQISGFWLK